MQHSPPTNSKSVRVWIADLKVPDTFDALFNDPNSSRSPSWAVVAALIRAAPIEVTWNFTLVGGLAAALDARDAGKQEVDAVLVDLPDDRDLIDEYIIAANLLRPLTDLEKTRCEARLFEIRSRRQPGSCDSFDELLKRLAEMHSCGIRNARRYLALATCPRAVQDAHEDGQVTLNLASRVGSLPEAAQREIAAAIAAGAPATETIESAIVRIKGVRKWNLQRQLRAQQASAVRILERMQLTAKQLSPAESLALDRPHLMILGEFIEGLKTRSKS